MAGRGPAPKSDNLRLLSGARQRKKAGTPEPTVLIDLEPPRWLDKEARAFWRRNVVALFDNRIITELDVPAFAIMAATWSMWRRLSDKIEALDSSTDLYRTLSIIRDRQANTLRLQLMDFGMTPSTRTRVQMAPLPEPAEVDEMEAFLTWKPERDPRAAIGRQADDPRDVLRDGA